MCMDLTQEELKNKLHYSPDTGVFTWLYPTSRGKKEGSVAGYLGVMKYRQIMIRGRAYLEHRLAFLYMTGSFPKKDTDHINRIRNDNRWCNLREATRSENCMNMSLRKDNSSGYRGVSWCTKDKRWIAQSKINKKYRRLGAFHTAIDASNAYQEFIKIHHGDFYNATGIKE